MHATTSVICSTGKDTIWRFFCFFNSDWERPGKTKKKIAEPLPAIPQIGCHGREALHLPMCVRHSFGSCLCLMFLCTCLPVACLFVSLWVWVLCLVHFTGCSIANGLGFSGFLVHGFLFLEELIFVRCALVGWRLTLFGLPNMMRGSITTAQQLLIFYFFQACVVIFSLLIDSPIHTPKHVFEPVVWNDCQSQDIFVPNCGTLTLVFFFSLILESVGCCLFSSFISSLGLHTGKQVLVLRCNVQFPS